MDSTSRLSRHAVALRTIIHQAYQIRPLEDISSENPCISVQTDTQSDASARIITRGIAVAKATWMEKTNSLY